MTSTDLPTLTYSVAEDKADGVSSTYFALSDGNVITRSSSVNPKGRVTTRWALNGKRTTAETARKILESATEQPAAAQEKLLPETPAESVQDDPSPTGDDEEPEATAVVDFTDTVSKGFWGEFGKKASRAVADLTGAAVSFDNSTKTTTFNGTRRQVLAAQTHLKDMYSGAADAHKTWKKTSTDYQALSWKTKEGIRAGSKMTRDFWTGYVDAYVSAAADSLI